MQSDTLSVESPSLALLSTEPWRAAFEFLSHKFSRQTEAASGDGHPVVFFPGLGTDGMALSPLREHCQSLGYTAIDWGRGYNTGPQGDVDEWLRELAQHTADLLAGFEQSASFVGWSLGGVYARELAKLMPPRVRQVITIGTPFNGLGDHTNIGWLYRLLNGATPNIDPTFSERLRTAPPMPTTSIFSRSDGIVAWQTCRHDKHVGDDASHVQDVEVNGSHIGMGWNPAVLRVVANRLAQPPGQWRRYAADVND